MFSYTDVVCTHTKSASVLDCSSYMLYGAEGNGNCMFESYYAKATVEQHSLGGDDIEAANILRGVRPGNAQLGAAKIRKAVVGFLRENKGNILQAGVLSKQRRRVSMKGKWEDVFEVLREVDKGGAGSRSYDEHLAYMSEDGSWGTTLGRVALSAMGLRGRVLLGEDRKALKFADPADDAREVVNREALLWHHPFMSEIGVKGENSKDRANHYDVLFSKEAVLYRKEIMSTRDGHSKDGQVVPLVEEPNSDNEGSSQEAKTEVPKEQFRPPRVPLQTSHQQVPEPPIDPKLLHWARDYFRK